MDNYEGQVIFADGSRHCLQCYDGRHDECVKVLPADYPSDLNCECCGDGDEV